MSENPFGYGKVSYENQRGANPYGYGCGNYGFIQPRKEDPAKAPFARGELVIWKKRNVMGKVVEDWKDYGVRIEVDDGRGGTITHRVERDALERGVTVLDVLSRI